MQLDVGVGKIALGHGKAVGEDSGHTLHVAAAFAQSVHGDKAALACRHEVFDDHYRLAFVNLALNLVGQAVRLGLGAYIHERLAQFLGHQGALGDAARGHTGHNIHVAPILVHHIDETLTDECAYLGIRKSDTVVAINGRFATRRPCKRVFVVKFYCFDLQ